MYIRLTPYHAQMIAQNVDYNYSGVIERNELKFRQGSKSLVDLNRDGHVTTRELADSLVRGDVYVSSDRKLYRTYPRPGFNFPGSGQGHFPPYGPSPAPGGYYPYPGYWNQAPGPQGPGYPYRSSNAGLSDAFVSTAVGAGVGAGVGAVVGGSEGAGTGALIGGAVGLFSNLLR